jgi:hypothetical protein
VDPFDDLTDVRMPTEARGCPVDLRRRPRRPGGDRRRCRRRRYNPGIGSSSALPDAAWIAVCIQSR